MFSERAERLRPERGRDELAHDPGVEGVAGQTDSAVAEQILRLAAALAHAGANVKQREVAGAAAKVTDEDQLVVIEGGFVGVRCRHGLHFKINPIKAGSRKGLAQAREGIGLILFLLRAHKTYRAAHHGVADRSVELLFRLAAQIGENAGNEIFESVMTAKYRCSGQGAIGQIGFERLNQPALVLSREVVFDGRRARPGMGSYPVGLFGLLQIKDRAKGKGLARKCGKGDHFHLRSAGGTGDRAVGGAEVNTDGRDLVLRLLHSLHYFSSALLDIDWRARPCCWHEKSAVVSPRRQLHGAAELARPEGCADGTRKVIVVGFVGGFVRHDDTKHAEVKFAAHLRERYRSAIDVEVFGNHSGTPALRARAAPYGHGQGARQNHHLWP